MQESCASGMDHDLRDLAELERLILQQISESSTIDELEGVRIRYLGRKAKYPPCSST